MSAPRLARGASLFLLLATAACGILPGAGPSLGTMKDSKAVEVVRVTPADAYDRAAALDREESAAIDRALAALQKPASEPSFTFGPGARIAMTLWSFSPRPGVTTGPAPTALGSYTVAADGAVLLPYVGKISLSGLTLQQAQDLVAKRFEALGLFQKPSVSIDVASSPQGQVLVTGAVGQPKAISWQPAGMTLAEALTQALGDGAALLGQEGNGPGRTVTTKVLVFRRQNPPVELPISAALERAIALQPGDRIVVRKEPAVEVTVLGAGVQGNGVFDFDRVPTLSEAIARGAGLNANAANDHAVFVLRERKGARPVLFDFSWNKAQGLVASHRFPLQSGDLVYVAEAPIVSVQRVINILFQVALPAQVLK